MGMRAVGTLVVTCLIVALPLPIWAAQIDIIGPPGSGAFGNSVTVLPNGNIVITDPDAGVSKIGAVYLYGPDGMQISRLTGSSPNDRIGRAGIVVLANGNFVVRSPDWSNGESHNAGAATWVDGRKGLSGVVSARNSLVGTTVNDDVAGFGHAGVIALSNGNYVVQSPDWNNGVTYDSGNDIGVHGAGGFGASTWGSGTSGIVGAISEANSLIGTTKWDHVGDRIVALGNGNYVVASPFWGNGVALGESGAATWGDGAMGVRGTISAANSLVGTVKGSRVGLIVTALSNGNYVVASPFWTPSEADGWAFGAATWANGTVGLRGTISSRNSLVGTTNGDWIGADGVTALDNGNYVVASSLWNDGVPFRPIGAVTWANGESGITGVVSAGNSLVGTNIASFRSGTDFNVAVTPLSNGNYVVDSPYWTDDSGMAQFVARGAATWGNGATGVVGPISSGNSLVGTATSGLVGAGGVIGLTNGNYVVVSPVGNINNPGPGAATWGNGKTGTTGFVSSANSLLAVSGGVTALSNGNYVASGTWGGRITGGAFAELWGDGSSGATGFIYESYSFSTLFNEADALNARSVTALSNGNYVVGNPGWNNGIGGSEFGAVTWVNGAAATAGTVSANNSMVGAIPGGQFGSGGIVAMSDGSYVVLTLEQGPEQPGSVTLIDGRFAVAGTPTLSNTVIGGTTYAYDPARRQLAVGCPQKNIVTLLRLPLQTREHSRRALPPLLLHPHPQPRQ